MKIVPVFLSEKSRPLGGVKPGKIVRLADSNGGDFFSAVAESGENFHLVIDFKGDKKVKEHTYLVSLDGQLVRARQNSRHAVIYDVELDLGKRADKYVRVSELTGGSIIMHRHLTCMTIKGGTPPPGGKVAMTSLTDGKYFFVDDDLTMPVYPEAQYTIGMVSK